MKTEHTTIALAVLLALAAPAAGAQILSVSVMEGDVSIDRGGTRIQAAPGAPVIASDIVHTASGARLSLLLSGHGELVLGPDSRLQVEKLPYADFAADLGSQVRLLQGTLQVAWRPPSGWALDVIVSGQHYGLADGEFRFRADGTDLQACLTRGRLLQAMQIPLCDRSGDVTTAVAAPAGTPVATPPEVEPAGSVYKQRLNREVRAEPPQPTGRPDPYAPAEAPTIPRPQAARGRFAPTAATAGNWAVNMASVARREGAEKMAQQLEQEGYRAVIVMAEVKGRITHRVQVPGFASQAEARAAARALSDQFGIKDAWVVRTP